MQGLGQEALATFICIAIIITITTTITITNSNITPQCPNTAHSPLTLRTPLHVLSSVAPCSSRSHASAGNIIKQGRFILIRLYRQMAVQTEIQ
jgi:hypothetical protein